MIYHRDIGFPKGVALPKGRLELTFSPHAVERSMEKGFPIPKFITLKRFDIVEISVFRGQVIKMLVRGSFDDRNDICIVIKFVYGENRVMTAWLNEKSDSHPTLDLTRYERV